MSFPKILVTGAEGWIGSLLIEQLRAKYGQENVVGFDVRRNPTGSSIADPFVLGDVANFEQLDELVKQHNINWVFHMAAILSMGCEADHLLAFRVNVQGFQNIMELARLHNLRIFSASSIVAFGPGTPMVNTPTLTIQRPPTLYGCTKVYNELLGEYYHRRWGVDFRCIRYPVVVREGGDVRKSIVGFASKIFNDAVRGVESTIDVEGYSCFPYLYMSDCVAGTIKLMETAAEKLTIRCYNVQAFSVTVEQLCKEIRKHQPNWTWRFEVDSTKQPYVDALVKSVEDSEARNDWGWNPSYNFENLVKQMLDLNRKLLTK